MLSYRAMGKGEVTIKDIALKTGFSKSTVSRVLCYDEHVSPETRRKILSCVEELNFKPNYFAQGLKTKSSKMIAFLVPNIEIMIYPAILQAMSEETRNRGYTIILCDIQEDKSIALDYVQKLKGMVDGFIFSTAFCDKEDNKEIFGALDSGIPSVNLLRTDGLSAPSVFLDNAKGAFIGVRYLLEKGKRRIAFLQGQEYLKLYKDRHDGYVEALRSYGIEVEPSLVWHGYNGSEKIAFDVVSEKIKRYSEVDAIFSSSDDLAVDAISALKGMGISVPEDISVVGYDNVPISEYFNPRLTTIGQPYKEMGRKAVDVLINIIEGKLPLSAESYIFDPIFIERDTVR